MTVLAAVTAEPAARTERRKQVFNQGTAVLSGAASLLISPYWSFFFRRGGGSVPSPPPRRS